MLNGRLSVAALVAVGLLVTAPPPSRADVPRCAGVRATIVGSDRPDRILGTAGPDVVVAGRGDDVVLLRGGNDLVCGGRGEDVLLGGPGADRLVGGPDGNTGRPDLCLQGDHLDGGLGADLLDPGVDPRRDDDVCGTLDEVRFRDANRAVAVDLTVGTARGQGDDRIVVDQPLAVVGSDQADTMVGSDLAEDFDPRHGDDRVLAGGGDDRIVEGQAANGDDVYDLGAGADFLGTFRGRDAVLGGADGDFLALWNPDLVQVDAGDGDDRVVRHAAPGGDVLDGGAGRDELSLDLPEESVDGSVLDIPAARWTIGDRAADVPGFEEWVFAAPVPWTVWGSEARDVVTASGYGSEHAPLTAYLLGGPDLASAYRSDDYVDGGEGADSADLGPGTNTCVDVESGTC